MSADNWSICPRCKLEKGEAHAAEVESFTAAYGKIPQDEYEEWREQLKPPTLEETLREDYKSFITEDGRLYIGYKASCRNCPFHYEFKKEEHLDVRFPA